MINRYAYRSWLGLDGLIHSTFVMYSVVAARYIRRSNCGLDVRSTWVQEPHRFLDLAGAVERLEMPDAGAVTCFSCLSSGVAQ